MKKDTSISFSPNVSEEDSGSDLPSDDEVTETVQVGKKRSISSASRKDPRKLKSAKFTKQPTTEELNRLRETENLFNSNFFRLQIEEVLKEVTVKTKYVVLFKKWFDEFNNFITKLEEKVSYKISDQEWLNEFNIKAPIIQEPFETKGYFNFFKCKASSIIGSHSYGCILGPNLTVDLKIEMPNETLHKNDYLNERYHRKRALYLCYIASKLNSSGLVEELKFKLFNGNNLKPVLIIKPSGKLSKHATIILHVGLNSEWKMSRFNPTKNNVRKDWRLNEQSTEEDSVMIATPYNNATILHDMTCDINNAFLIKSIIGNENIKQGILLLKIWLKQRQLHHVFSGYIISMFVAHLIQIRRINNAMSSYQVIRNVWTTLAASEWDKAGISLYTGERSIHHPSIFEFHSYFPVVFLDYSGYHNICSHIDFETYNTLRHESQLAVNYLDSQQINGFLPLFMNVVDFNMKYDHILRIENTKKLRNVILKEIDSNTKVDCGPDFYYLVQMHLANLIRKCLGKRISIMTPKCLTDEELSWPVNVKASNGNHHNTPYIFGFKLNPEYAFSSIDKGPQANLPEAERFREFWGAKSELRRFQDGSISEACVWQSSPTMAAKRLIVKQILYYLLQTKLGIEDKLFYIADQFEFVLHNKRFQPADFDYGTGEEASSKISLSFDELMKNLRSLTEMPLEIHSILGVSSVFSFSDPIPTLPYAPISATGFKQSEKYRLIRDEVKQFKKKSSERVELVCPIYVPALKVVMELSQSGKWPDEIEAFKRIKAAFNIQISEALSSQCQLTSHPWQSHVDVFKDGYVYRLEISHRKEINLMKKSVDKNGVTKFQDTDESLELEYNLMLLPRLRIALNGLHHQHSSYGSAACLLKRWIRSHLFDSFHFPDVCIDMLIAYIYLKPEPYEQPNQPQVAFWRALHLLATMDWNTQMIILNFNEDLSREEITEIESNFSLNRSSLPAMFFVTPYEGSKPSIWSRSAPTYQVLARVQILAVESFEFVKSIIFEQLSNDVKILFEPNLDGFDVLIHLNHVLNPLSYLDLNKHMNSVPKKCKSYEKAEEEFFPVVEFNPVQIYLNQLRESYDEFALFFHNTYGGDLIAVLWKPPALEFKEFKTSLVNGRKPVTKHGKPGLIVDLDAILEGCLILGEGLVKEIENKTNLTL